MGACAFVTALVQFLDNCLDLLGLVAVCDEERIGRINDKQILGTHYRDDAVFAADVTK